MSLKKTILLLLVVVALIYTVGVSTQVYLGDEVYHHRVAKYFFENGRPVFEPNYQKMPEIGYKVTGPIFWYEGLAAVWKLFHSNGKFVTQGYQAFFYLLLLAAAYFMTKASGSDESESILSTWLIASCPMVVAFSIFLYLDVPACALMMLTFLFIFRKKFLAAGTLYAAFIMTKEYAFFLLPGILTAIFLSKDASFFQKAKQAVTFSIIAFLILIPDIQFRLQNFGFAYYTPPHSQFVNKSITYWYVPASLIHDPLGALSYLGIAIAAGLICYLFFRDWRRQDSILALAAGFYCFLISFFFYRTLDMRYFMPAVCLLSPLAARGFLKIRSPFFRFCFYAIFAIQILGTAGVLAVKRQIPQGIKQGFDFIKEKTSSEGAVFYPGESIMDYTGRPVVWLRIPHLEDLLWSPSLEKVQAALKEGHIDYVVIPAERIYDDAKIHHLGGYPKSFVERLKQGNALPFIKEVYSNPQISVWEVRKESAV